MIKSPEAKARRALYQKQYRIDNRKRLTQYLRDYYRSNKAVALEKAKAKYQDVRIDIMAQHKVYRAENKEMLKAKAREYTKRKRATDPIFRLRATLRSRLNNILRKNKSGSAIKDLGCSVGELKAYIESKWTAGMSWDNWSKTGWHVDHIKPLSMFDLTDRAEFLQACHYTNLQPLWAFDNMSKSNKRA